MEYSSRDRISTLRDEHRKPVSSQFFENISPVTPITGPSGPRSISPSRSVSPVSIDSSLRHEIVLELPSQARSLPPYRSASSTGFTAPYHAVGSSDEQYRFEKPKPRVKSKGVSKWVGNLFSRLRATWLPSVCSLVVCLTCFIIAVAVLQSYDGTQLSEWPHSMTPNAFLAVFISLAQASLLVIISEGLVRSKETMETSARICDEASRSPIGSLKLIWFLKGRQLGSLAAVLTILALAISPMTQQIVHYPSFPAPTTSGPLPFALRSISYATYTPNGNGVGIPDMSMHRNLKSALFTSPSNSSHPSLTPFCPPGLRSCTFPSFSSLAICSKTADVSSLLTITPLAGNASAAVYNVSLPNGAYLQAGGFAGVSMNISTPLALVDGKGVAISNHSLAFATEPNVVFTALNNYFVIFRNSTSDQGQPSFAAVEALTFWCVNTYDVSITNGIPITTITATSSNVISESAEVSNGTSTKYGEMVLSSAGNRSEGFKVDGRANQVLAEYLARTFAGYCEETTGDSWSSDAAFAVDLSLADGSGEAGMRRLAGNVAIGMTNAIRALAADVVPGTAYALVPHIDVRWGWLSFLIVFIVATIVFWLAIVWELRGGIVSVSGDGDHVRGRGEIRDEVQRAGRNGADDGGLLRRGHERHWSEVGSVI